MRRCRTDESCVKVSVGLQLPCERAETTERHSHIKLLLALFWNFNCVTMQRRDLEFEH